MFNIPTKLCVIDNSEDVDAFNHEIKVKVIHRFKNFLWLGKSKKVKYFAYRKEETKSIMTIDGQFVVPRDIDGSLYNTTRIMVSKKSIYNLREGDLLKEVVLFNGKPKLIDYRLGKYTSLSDEGKGIKGYLYIPKGELELIII